MAKGSSSLRNNKARSSKPYDASNSFVRKVTAQVTNLLPQPEWLTRWFSSSSSSSAQKNAESDDEGEVAEAPQPPPNKRAKISLNRTFPTNSFRVANEAELRDRRPQFESPSPVRHAYTDAVAGPSGLSTSARFSTSAALQSTMVSETLENKLNGDGGSDSSESTSGCSSLVPQSSKQSQGETLAARRRAIDDKLSLTNHLQSPRSLFPNRTRTPRIVPPPSRRRPSFNASVFGSPLLESDKLPSKELSPFYSGRTMYGGASAYRRPRENSLLSDLNVSKRGIQVRPVNATKESPEASMSHTARRILEALEQFSSPVQEAKRMPLNCPTYRPPLGTKRKCVENEGGRPPPPPPLPPVPPTGPPTRALAVPSVADLIKMRSKEKLQDSMESARRIASGSAEPYSIRSNEERKGGRHMGKLKSLDHVEYQIDEVSLPDVALPITTMPKFDIMVPPASSSAALVFKFSPPITVVTSSPAVEAGGEFVFSAPLSGRGDSTSPVVPVVPVVTRNFLPSCPSQTSTDNLKRKPKSDAAEFGVKTGSVMDFFSQQKKREEDKSGGGFGAAFKPAADTWECDVCMIRNKEDASVCAACESPRQSKAPPLAKPNGGWTCSECLVPNRDADAKCVCCTNPRSGPTPAKRVAGEPAVASWNCAACDASNPASSSSCGECWSNRPTVVGTTPKTAAKSAPKDDTSTWTCCSCVAVNDEGSTVCKNCKKNKVDSNKPSSKITFNFEIPAEASMFKFGIDKSGNPPGASDNKLGGFKFGETPVTTPAANFTFGMPSSAVAQADKQNDVTVTSASSTFMMPAKEASKVGDNTFGSNLNQNSEVTNSSVGLVKKGSDSVANATTKGSLLADMNNSQQRKASGAESAVNEVKSAQKRKAESAETGASEVKVVQKEKQSPGSSKPNAENMAKPTTIPSIFSAAVSSSSFNGAGVAGSAKTTSSGGFSFVSSSTSTDKSAAMAPSFVFGSGSSKSEEPASKKPAALFSAPVSTAAGVPTLGSSVTSSANAVSSSATLTFGTSPKSLFGNSGSKSVFGTPATAATTTPSFGVADTTTPTFGASVTKPNAASTTLTFGTPATKPTTASTTPTFGVAMTKPSAAPTAPTFGASTTKPSATPTSPFGASAAKPSATPSTPTFGASVAKPSVAPTTSVFGTPATKPNAASTTPTFGASVTKPSATSATPTFGASATKPSAACTTPTFGTSVSKPSAATTTSATLMFGGSSNPSAPSLLGTTPATTAPTFSAGFGVATTTSTSGAGFGAPPVTTMAAFGTATTTASMFGSASSIFGSSAAAPTQSAFGSGSATPSFGAPATTTAPAFGVTSAAPAFGSAPTTTTPAFGTATSSFGSNVKVGNFGGTTPAPNFGIPSSKTPFGSAPVTHSFGKPSATPTFGSSAAGTGAFGSTSTQGFGAPATTSTVSFGTPTATPSFGASNQSFATPKTEPATAAPIFGKPTTTVGFGSGFNTATPAFAGFSTGTLKSGTSTPSQGAFVFKGSSPSIFNASQSSANNTDCPQPKVPNFGFGSAGAGTSNTAPATSGFGTFNFSAGTSAAPSVFGASSGGTEAPSSSVFGSGSTPAFGSGGGFGSSTGGFNFGSGSNTGAQPFSFSGTQGTQGATPAFGQQPQPAPPTFNPNVRPSFDFTGGERPQFTAQSSSLVPPTRRIKKAVRRTNR